MLDSGLRDSVLGMYADFLWGLRFLINNFLTWPVGLVLPISFVTMELFSNNSP